VQKWAELADFLIRNDGLRPVVFHRTRRAGAASDMRRSFPASTIFSRPAVNRLNSPRRRHAWQFSFQMTPAPVHIAAAVENSDRRIDRSFDSPRLYSAREPQTADFLARAFKRLTSKQVYDATRELLTSERAEHLVRKLIFCVPRMTFHMKPGAGPRTRRLLCFWLVRGHASHTSADGHHRQKKAEKNICKHFGRRL
jgi:hypothetical protein